MSVVQVGHRTESQIIASMEAIASREPHRSPGEFTRREFERIVGTGERGAVLRLRELIDKGLVEHAMVEQVSPWGVRRTYPGYRVVSKNEKAS